MRDLTNMEVSLVGGGFVTAGVGDITALNNVAFGNDNSIGSDNRVQANGNASGNASANTITATVSSALSAAGL